MIRLEDPRKAVKLGLRIVDELAAPGAPPVRVGMHSGPAVGRDGDWFGGSVNLASRVSGAARAGEVLLTGETRRVCGQLDAIDFEPRGSHYFKHIPEPVPVYRAVSAGASGASLEIDPVCRMAVDPQRAAAVRHRRGFTYYFCSPECERAFAADPRRYVANSPAARAARAGFRINLAAFLIVGAVHALAWATGWTHHESEPPLFLYVGAAWAIGLALHYRAVRRVSE
jgi:YHS domain-containing protein